MFKDFPEIKLLLIVALVAVVISFGGILLLRNDVRNQVSPAPGSMPSPQTPVADDISNWQTYRNDEFGFEVRYPGDEWEFSEVYSFGVVKFQSLRSQYAYIYIKILPIAEGKTADEVMIAKTSLGECGGSDCSHPSLSQFSRRQLGANSFYYIQDNLFEQQYSVVYYLPNSNKDRVAQVRLSSIVESGGWTDPDYSVDKEPNHSALKQILSTFRFIE